MNSSSEKKKGKFIVFEGLDGSGKTTQLRLLNEKLKAAGIQFHTTAEPTSSVTGGMIRDALSGSFKREPAELAALFLADRIFHNVNEFSGFGRLLDEGIHVICDRYYYSSFAYQGLDTDIKWVMDMNLMCEEIRKPDMCIFIDADPDTCKNRIDNSRKQHEIYEADVETMRRTRNNFYKVFDLLEKTENIIIIHSDKPEDILSNEVYKIVSRFINE